MCLGDLIPVIVGFALGLLGGPIKDYVTDKQKARRLTRMTNVELGNLGSRLDNAVKRLQSVTEPASWYERSVTFTDSWFWNQTDTLALLQRQTLTRLVVLRVTLKQLEADYREIEQDIGVDGRMFPREHVLDNFDQLRNNIQSRTDEAKDLIRQVRGQ